VPHGQLSTRVHIAITLFSYDHDGPRVDLRTDICYYGVPRGGGKLLLHLEARLKPVNNSRLMLRTGEHGNRPILKLEHRLVGIMWCKATARAPDAAGRAVVQ
jgi:hypothetical protein